MSNDDDTDTTKLRLILPLIAGGIGAAIPLIALILIFTVGELDTDDKTVMGFVTLLVIIAALLAFAAYTVVFAFCRIATKKP